MPEVRVADRYLLLHLIGSGGMGRVWLAQDETLHRPVAMKQVIPPGWLTPDERDELGARTLREARTAARLNHPNVVRVYDVLHSADSPWIVMEYVPSRSLQQVLDTDGPLTPHRTAEVGLAVLAALRAAHASGVLHRDVKPHNVLIADDGRVVLTDFGLATVDGGDGALTRDGVVLGSPQYVAPERAADGSSTVESDLWSLGATLYAAVEGRSPYSRPTAMATLAALAVAPPDPTTRAGPLGPVLAGLLRRDPRQRLTADEVERLLRRIVDPARAHPARQPAAPGHPSPEIPAAGPPRDGIPAAGRGPDRGDRADPPRRATPPRPDPVDRSGPTEPVVTPGPVRRWPRHLLAAVSTVAVVAALGVGFAVWAQQEDGGTPMAVRSETPDEPLGEALDETLDTTAPSGFPCTSGSGGVPVSAAPRPSDERFGLIENWTWYTDPSGFRIAVPIGWLRYTDGTVVCFREPVDGTARVLSVDPATPPTPDAEAYWRERERQLLRQGTLAGYEQVAIGPLDIRGGGAVWECRWTNPRGDRVHAVRMLINSSARRAYTISWLTRDFDWGVNQSYLRMLQTSFRPAD